MADGEITMLDWGGSDEDEPPPSSRPRKRRSVAPAALPAAAGPVRYIYKGVRGGPLIAGYVK